MARNSFDYDLVILGGGSAGIVAGNVAGALGARVALVEQERIGGECLWTGCVPSKALLFAAQTAHTMRRADSFGLRALPLSREDCAGAFRYAREKIEEVKNNDATEKMLRDFGVDLFFGESTFLGPNVLRTAGRELRAAHYLIATGSSPAVPDLPGLRDAGFLTNKTLFDLDAVPESLVVIGGGYVACEMAQALSRLGCSVTIVSRSARILPKEDEELAEMLARTLRGEGITILDKTSAVSARRFGAQKAVTLRDAGGEREVIADEMLIAAGRRANTDGIAWDALGATLDTAGNVTVDATGRTTVANVWACGDVTGRFPFSHMAEHEAKIVVRNILFPGRQKIPYDVVPWATFTEPELARVGLTEAEARERYGAKKVQLLRHEFRQDDRAIVEGATTGVVKVITTGLNGTVVGAHIFGPHAGEMIHEWVIALRHGLPVRAIADLIHVYPTVSVSNQRAAQRWYGLVSDQPLVKTALRTLFGYRPRSASRL
jgi:pyruvate/2-oxoglutarate dehydrogenase complex dihydrolipoamide dehydrogenase (E3) component